ncbi:unnamed protein product, partial [Polarella glacialis]
PPQAPHLEEMVVGLEEDKTFDGHDPRAHDHSRDHRKGGRRGGLGEDGGFPGDTFLSGAVPERPAVKLHRGVQPHHWHMLLK